MISYLATRFWIYEMSGSTPQNRAPGEYFPAMEEARFAAQKAKSADHRNRLRSGWKAIAGAPHFVISQATRLVPASIKAALNARAEAKVLAINIRRLEELSPHLLADIGIEHVARGVYAMMETEETLAEVPTSEPAVTAFPPEPAAPVAKPAPHHVRRPSAGWAPAVLAGAASL